MQIQYEKTIDVWLVNKSNYLRIKIYTLSYVFLWKKWLWHGELGTTGYDSSSK